MVCLSGATRRVGAHVALLLFGVVPFGICSLAQNNGSEVDSRYATAKSTDDVAILAAKINSGEFKLAYEPNQGYLRSLLDLLHVSKSSQILVFSKTSIQSAYISPQSPRAVYFNDRTYVGWIRGAPNLEFASIDPKIGPIFYTLANEPAQKPRLVRQTDECLQCHNSSLTGNVPGFLARSVYAGPDGTPKLAGGSYNTTPASPIKERWGGWYVTGVHGDQRHMGNEVARGDYQNPTLDTEKGANVTRLNGYFDVEAYLTPHSDIVALMVAEQQMRIQNLITKASYQTEKAIQDAKELRKFGFTEAHVAESTRDRIKNVCDPLVLALTDADEAPLTSPIKGTSKFTETFSASAPADQKGRRLSELDLTSRLMKYPCSPMIYSPSFAALPSEARDYVLQHLKKLLSGRDRSAQIALKILSETLPRSASHELEGQ